MKKSLAELAEITGGEVLGAPETEICGIAPFDEAGPADITFADAANILKRICDTRAGAVIVPEYFDPAYFDPAAVPNAQPGIQPHFIRTPHPRLAFAKIMHLFFPPARPGDGIHPAASVGEHGVFGNDVSVGPLAVIQDHVTIGSRVVIHPHVTIGSHVTIGDDAIIYPHVTILERCTIGSRVIIHAGTVIGSDGYGFVPDGAAHFKIPQLGIVQVDDDVEIGACNTIDRATFGKTWIQQGVKTDNHVQIAHNVVVGENTLIVAQVGIAGSTRIGRNVTLAGQAGIAGHLTIGDFAVVGPQAGVTRNVPAGTVVSGTPEMPHKQWLRTSRIIQRLPELKRKMAELEKRLNEQL